MRLVRPDLGNIPEPARRWVEPFIFAAAISGIATLLGVGLVGFTTLLFAAALLQWILTRVFGLEFDFSPYL
jgi:hypothetical protein